MTTGEKETFDRKKLRRRALMMFFLMAPISVGLLFFVVYVLGDLEKVPAVLERTNWKLFFLAPLAVPVFYIMHGLRLSIALKSAGAPPVRLRDMARCILAGNLVNAALPGMGGELVTAYLGSKFYKVKMPFMLASSAYSKVVALATNVSLALVGLLLMPPVSETGRLPGLTLLFKVALGGLLAAALLALMFPGLVEFGGKVLRWMFRVSRPEPTRWSKFAGKAANGLDKTAELFRTLRRTGIRTTLKLVSVTLLVNCAFSFALVVGFISVGYWPEFYQVLLFYSVLIIIFITTMIFVGGVGAVELTAIAYWSQITGLNSAEILVAMLAVKLWQLFEMGTAMFLLQGYFSRLPKEDVMALLRRRKGSLTDS